MTYLALARAIRALGPTDVTTYIGEAVAPTTLPWITLNIRAPGSTERTLASTPLVGVARLAVTIAAASEDAALVIAEKVTAALDGARPSALGWQCSPLEQDGDVNTYADDVVIASVNRHVAVGHLSFSTTVARTA